MGVEDWEDEEDEEQCLIAFNSKKTPARRVFLQVLTGVSVFPAEQRYIGSTSDLRSRRTKHNAGEVPHTSKFKPWKAGSYFAFETKEKAAAFEAYLKTGSGHAFANRHF